MRAAPAGSVPSDAPPSSSGKNVGSASSGSAAGPPPLVEQRTARDIARVRRQFVADDEIRHRATADVPDPDQVAEGVAGVGEAVAVGVHGQLDLLRRRHRGEGGHRRAEVDPGRAGARRGRVLPPGGGEAAAAFVADVEEHPRLVAVVVVDPRALQMPEREQPVVAVAGAVGEGAPVVAVVIDAHRDRARALRPAARA